MGRAHASPETTPVHHAARWRGCMAARYVYLRSFEAEPRSIAVEVTSAPVRNTAEVEEAFAKLGRVPGGGLIVPPDAFTFVHHFIRLAQEHRVPAVYSTRATSRRAH